MAVNHKPVIRGTDTGIWRRVRLIPFTVTFDEDRQDKTLPAKLREELPGLLAWAVAGCLEWQLCELGVPDEVKKATGDYQSEMDAVAQFGDERCTVLEDLSVRSSALYQAWIAWCKNNGEAETSNKAFSLKVEGKGFKKTKRKNGVWFTGIGLNADPDDEGDDS